MEAKTLQPVCLINKQADRISQELTVEGCRVKINFLSSSIDKEKENVLSNIKKSLLAACKTK